MDNIETADHLHTNRPSTSVLPLSSQGATSWRSDSSNAEDKLLARLVSTTSSRRSSLQLDEPWHLDVSSWASAVRLLYAAHFLARWAWRTWEFAVALILMRLYPDSLLLVSVYGVLDNIVRLLLGSAVGNYIDRTDRLRGACSSYILQNACIAASASAAGILVVCTQQLHMQLQPQVYWTLLCVCMGMGAFSSVGSTGATVSVEREWTKTLCGLDSAALSTANARLRAIDLSCQMLAPMFAGILMTYTSMWIAIAVIGCYSMVVWLPEVLLLRAAYTRSLQLRQPKHSHQVRYGPLAALVAGWHTYFSEATVLAALALALLYLTVLSLGLLMTGYVKHLGMSEALLSVFRAAGALSGLAATAIFPPLQRVAGLRAAGGVGIAWQLCCLLAGTSPALLAAAGLLGAGGKVLSAALLGGLVASRCGLWLFDLAVCQLQQDYVEPGELGAVSGVQASMQSLFEILSFLAGCVLHEPQQFHWLMLGSLCSVASAAVLYGIFCSMFKPEQHRQRYQLVVSQSSM